MEVLKYKPRLHPSSTDGGRKEREGKGKSRCSSVCVYMNICDVEKSGNQKDAATEMR